MYGIWFILHFENVFFSPSKTKPHFVWPIYFEKQRIFKKIKCFAQLFFVFFSVFAWCFGWKLTSFTDKSLTNPNVSMTLSEDVNKFLYISFKNTLLISIQPTIGQLKHIVIEWKFVYITQSLLLMGYFTLNIQTKHSFAHQLLSSIRCNDQKHFPLNMIQHRTQYKTQPAIKHQQNKIILDRWTDCENEYDWVCQC